MSSKKLYFFFTWFFTSSPYLVFITNLLNFNIKLKNLEIFRDPCKRITLDEIMKHEWLKETKFQKNLMAGEEQYTHSAVPY